MRDLLNKIKEIVYDCGKIIINADFEELGIENKNGVRNIVTKYDKIIQDKLEKELCTLIPDSVFVGEENDLNNNVLNNGYTFIVDPIDGTTNFSRNFKFCSISVGLLKDGEPFLSVCYNPYLDEMFVAEKGKGAFLNGEKIKVSNKKN